MCGSVEHHVGFEQELQATVLKIFDREPIDAQPLVIIGNGLADQALLSRIYELVATTTVRGRLFGRLPLRLEWSDFANGEAFIDSFSGNSQDLENALIATSSELFSDGGPFAQGLLIAAARVGFFPRQHCFWKFYGVDALTHGTMVRFEHRSYLIRIAKMADLPELCELEKQCWQPGIRTSATIIKKRIERWSAGQLVVELEGQIVGCVYSQRLSRIDDLNEISVKQVDRLHAADGPIVQLLALNVLPPIQNKHIGDQLLEFMLQYATSMKSIDTVIGVTRCKNFDGSKGRTLESYIRLRNEYSQLFDPVLAMHESHGAQIRRLVPGYRPKDVRNNGNGVLVTYDLRNRHTKIAVVDVASPTGVKQRLGGHDVSPLEKYLTDKIIASLRIPREDVVLAQPLMELGLDSTDLLALGRQLSADFGIDVPSLFFFEHDTCEKVIAHFSRLARTESVTPRAAQFVDKKNFNSEKEVTFQQQKPVYSGTPSREIAVVGMACRLPKNIDTPDLFWSLLEEGGDAIGDLPSDRWQWPASIDPQTTHPGIATGGFLDDIARFDASFFRVSPREAEIMDPQQRILLELSWACIEDAGYSAKYLASSRTAVYVGASGSDYKRTLDRSTLEIEAHFGLATSMSILANRISYFYDFRGPSLQVDTACSSSLVAVHEAIAALRRNDCSQALVGGINIICDSALTIAYYKAGMLSKDGRCKVFDRDANGYVRSEGAVMLLLKPLNQAKQAGDHIYALLKGSAVNHSGQTSGLTVPSSARQTELLLDAYNDANVEPSSVDYLEAHGTGTSLGDPIEFHGIKEAFLLSRKQNVSESRQCLLGSVKSNLGHLEAAAGIAGLLKIVLSLQHGMIPASLHFRVPNPKLDIESSSFSVASQASRWIRQSSAPRRAGVSSFGSGGTNAHVVVEEYLEQESVAPCPNDAHPCVIVISAKTETQLIEQLRRLNAHVKVWNLVDADLENLAYTLQVGRDAMEHRLGFVATSIAELQKNLRACLENNFDTLDLPHIYRGSVKSNKEILSVLNLDEDAEQLIETWMKKRRYGNVLQLWTRGLSVDWGHWCSANVQGAVGQKYRRLSLPTYPFAGERYWVQADLIFTQPQLQPVGRSTALSCTANSFSILHPLLQRNTSDLSEQRYSSIFDGSEFFLADHLVLGRRLLPGAATVEMACEAVVRARGLSFVEAETSVVQLRRIVWVQPIAVGSSSQEIHIGLRPDGDGEISYEIYSIKSGANASYLIDDSAAVETTELDVGRIVHSRGVACIAKQRATSRLDIDTLKRNCKREVHAKKCYEVLNAMGLQYGPSHKGVVAMHLGVATDGSSYALAHLEMPECLADTEGAFHVHPSMLDAAIQIAVLLPFRDILKDRVEQKINASREPALSIPFSVDRLEILARIPRSAIAYVRPATVANDAQSNNVDIDICDNAGKLCASLKGFATRNYDNLKIPSSMDTILRVREWQERPHSPSEVSSHVSERKAEFDRRYHSHHVVIHPCYSNYLVDVQVAFPGANCELLNVTLGEIGASASSSAEQLLTIAQSIGADAQGQRTLIQVVIPSMSGAGDARTDWWLSSLVSLLRSARLEQPSIVPQLIELGDRINADSLIRILSGDAMGVVDLEIKYERDKRYASQLKKMPSKPRVDGEESLPYPWRNEGVYLITGGAGGLGGVFAREIVRAVRAPVVILMGRAELDVRQRERINALADNDARIDYYAADVNDAVALAAAIKDIVIRHGHLDGIIHCAGLIKDSLLIKKSVTDFRLVLAPKVNGTLNLDQATKDLKLDFLILFSSTAAELGNIGQIDYAFANAFMDRFATHRCDLARSKERYGRTLSINWPLWEEGGMQVDHAVRQSMKRQGLQPLATIDGLAAFYTAYAGEHSQVVVTSGNDALIGEKLLRNTNAFAGRESASDCDGAVGDRTALLENILKILTLAISSVLRVPVIDVDLQAEFREFGFDSITLTEFGNALAESCGVELAPTVFFEHENIFSLANYLCGEFGSVIAANLRSAHPVNHISIATTEQSILRAGNARNRFVAKDPSAGGIQKKLGSVAIVGMTGRFPGAADVDAFWENLRTGQDCITDIPLDRWDAESYFDADKGVPGKSYCRWGGFIEGIDEFNSLFFNISPRESSQMDSQERLFLEAAWNLLESSGYTKESLQKLCAGRVGVYAGSMYGQQIGGFNEIAAASRSVRPRCDIANRVSYFFGFSGPSIFIDTMCSSAATAIHLACKDLLAGECSLAIAGAVNLSTHPHKYVGLSGLQVLGSSASCRSFSDGDGYIPAETVGAILLKPLAAAISENDSILAVIKATAISHSGQSNGYWLPNLTAQVDLIKSVLAKADVEPHTISYVEAAANGSAISDAIEIAALTKAFENFSGEKAYCALGSVKSNIGHAEAASAISQLVKVVLQLSNKQLTPTIKLEQVNPSLRLEDTPFYFQRELTHWRRPVFQSDGKSREIPRRALINSFGAGGSYAALLLEEYTEDKGKDSPTDSFATENAVIVLSARTRDDLSALLKLMLNYLRSDRLASLSDIAYTLQIGRQHMNCRLSCVVPSTDELTRALESYLNNESQPGSASETTFIYVGQMARGNESTSVARSAESTELMTAYLKSKDLQGIARLWATGVDVDWYLLNQYSKGRRIRLPTYPFNRLRGMSHNDDTVSSDLAALQKRETIEGREKILGDVINLVCKELHVTEDDIETHLDLMEYGLDSVLRTRVAKGVGEFFGIAISGREMVQQRSIEDIARLVFSKTNLSGAIPEIDSPPTEAKKNGVSNSTISEKPDDIVSDIGVDYLHAFKSGALTLVQLKELIEKGHVR